MAITVAELLKGREKLPEEEKSAGSVGMENLTRAIQEAMLSSNENVTKVSKTTTDNVSIKDLSSLQMDMLKEQRKTNSLLSDLLENESKYFENNRELLDRLLMSQEQMLERKTGSLEAISKSAEPTEPKKEKKESLSNKDLAGGALALGPLIAILGAALPEIISFMKEKFPGIVSSMENAANSVVNATKSFTQQPELARDAERMGVLAAKPAGMAAARALERSAEANAADAVKTKAARSAVKAARSEAADAAESLAEKVAKPVVVDTAEILAKKLGTEAAIETVETAGKSVLKSQAKAAAKKVAGKLVGGASSKLVPFIGTLLGAADAGWRMMEGDYSGAALSFGSSLASNIPGIGTAAGFAGLTALAAHDVYKEVYTTDPNNIVTYEDDVYKHGKEYADRRMMALGPLVAEALKEELQKLNSSEGSSASLNDQEPIYDPMSGNVIGYQPKLPTGGSESGGTGRREPADAAKKPAGINPAVSGQGYTPPAYPVPRATPNLQGGQSGGGTVVNDNRTINNIDNSKAGGGGSAPGFPNSSTAPSNPWDKPLYGDNMYYF